MSNDFTHLNENNQVQMVDVGGKSSTQRVATALSIVELPEAVLAKLIGNDIQSKKGPVFQTAILAGILAAKKTSDLIPLCHPLALNKVDIDIQVSGNELHISCTTSCNGKTGVEMEALTGASVAALTIYDMCKGLSHDIVIAQTRLMSKTGGKSDYTGKA